MEEDRISQLPDEILQHILSFIDIYEAVETSILSKRWKDLWRSLPGLRFHLSRAAAHSRVPIKNAKDTKDFSPRFSCFVSHFLSRRDAAAPVHDFHLSIDTIFYLNTDTPFVEACVLYAINHDVQSLRLHAPCYPSLRLPSTFYASKTLRELEIRQLHSAVYLPGRFSLPNLKSLYLETYLVFDDYYKPYGMEPFAGLPELEKLSLCGYPMAGLVLKAPKLRVLELLQYSHNMEEISAPLLTSFRYENYSPLECSKMNLPMLEKVYLDIHHIGYHVMNGMHLNCVRMLQQLGNATIVSLTLDTLKALELDGGPIEQSPPPFPNLKCLKLVKGSRKIRTVLQSVMNYLTMETMYFESMIVEFPDDVTVVEQNSEYMSDEEDTDWGFDHLFRN